MIYHYTTLEYAQKIFETGYLKVSHWEKSNKIKPAALWLSKNPFWEHTASKAIRDDSTGESFTLTFQQQHELIGCARFVLPFVKMELCTWPRYRYASNTPYQIYQNMEKIGIQQGSKPSNWYASFCDISLDKVIAFEIWDGTQWVDYSDDFKEAIDFHFRRLNEEHHDN